MKRLFAAIPAFLLSLLICGAASAERFSKMTEQYFSTASVLTLTIEPEQRPEAEALWQEIRQILGEVEQAVSVSVPESDVARFNALPSGGHIPVRALTTEILQIAMRMFERTGGLYDPTVYPLVDLWGFTPRFNQRSYAPSLPYDRAYENGRLPLPDPAMVKALLPLVGFEGIRLWQENGTWMLRKDTPGVVIDGIALQAALDLGGLAKGYACDRVREAMLAHGFTTGTFACGGSSMVVLSSTAEDGCYELTLHKPRPGKENTSHYATLRIRETTLSSSADYNHCRTQDGVVYCHIIDPRTGWPLNTPEQGSQRGIATVSLTGESAAENDAMTTALCLMGPEEALKTMARLPGAAVAAVYARGQEHLEILTNLSPELLTIDDEAYLPASRREADGSLVYTGTLMQ